MNRWFFPLYFMTFATWAFGSDPTLLQLKVFVNQNTLTLIFHKDVKNDLWIDPVCDRNKNCDALKWVNGLQLEAKTIHYSQKISPSAKVCRAISGAHFEKGYRENGGEVGICRFKDGSRLTSRDLVVRVKPE